MIDISMQEWNLFVGNCSNSKKQCLSLYAEELQLKWSGTHNVQNELEQILGTLSLLMCLHETLKDSVLS